MAGIKSLTTIVEKWTTETPGRQKYLEAGLKAPKRPWSEAAAEGEGAYEAGVSQAIADKRFGKGVKQAGDAKWSRKALDPGVSRYGPGVRAAAPDYKSGFAPFRETIAAVTLPARGARGDPANLERVKAIADALYAKRVAMGAS